MGRKRKIPDDFTPEELEKAAEQAAKKAQRDTELNEELEIFFDAIEKIEKITPISAREGATWKFYITIKDKTAIIIIPNTDLLYSPSKFENLYKSRFGAFLPYALKIKNEEGQQEKWCEFQNWIESTNKKIEVTPEESVEWAECDAILDKIAINSRIFRADIKEENEKWADPSTGKNTLLRKINLGRTYYMFKSNDMLEYIKEMKCVTSAGRIGDAMNEQGFKRPGNVNHKVKGIQIRAWWFTAECMNDHGLARNPYISAHNPTNSEEAADVVEGY